MGCPTANAATPREAHVFTVRTQHLRSDLMGRRCIFLSKTILLLLDLLRRGRKGLTSSFMCGVSYIAVIVAKVVLDCIRATLCRAKHVRSYAIFDVLKIRAPFYPFSAFWAS